jgi:hypothetical protein
MAEPAPQQRLNAIRVIRRTFGAVRGDFLRLFLYTFVLSVVPVFLVQLAVTVFVTPQITPLVRGGGSLPLQLTFRLISTVVGLFSWAGSGAVMFAVLARFKGDRPGIARSMLAGARFYLPLLVFAFIFHLGLLIGLVLLVVPGVIGATVMLVAGAVMVGERAGINDSFQRSAFLSRGSRWIILGLIVAYVLFNYAIGYISLFFTLPLMGFYRDGISIVRLLAGIALSSVFSAIALMIRSAGVVAIYHGLREIKENPLEEELGQVFE